MEQTMRVEVEYVREPIDYMPLARHLLDKMIECFKDPENEKRFQEWKAAGGYEAWLQKERAYGREG